MATITYTSNFIEGITDKAEYAFALLAYTSGYTIEESPMLIAARDNRHQQRTTVPDFILKKNKNDTGIFIEVTAGSKLAARKNRQKTVAKRLGLSKRYY